jgi:hypothetical protein
MNRFIVRFLWISVFLTACQPVEASPAVQYPSQSPAQAGIPSTSLPDRTPEELAKPHFTVTTTSEPPAVQPAIHDTPGALYTTVFTVPVGGNKPIQYFDVNGPNTIAIRPDGSFLIGDIHASQIYHYSSTGKLLDSLDLTRIGIQAVNDMLIRHGQLYLLETSYHKYRVHRLSLDGRLLESQVVPYDYRIGSEDAALEFASPQIGLDCEDNLILDIGGILLFHLAEVQKQASPDQANRGYFCNGKRYRNEKKPYQAPKLEADGMSCESTLTKDYGMLSFLEVFTDGGFYLIRDDPVSENPTILVDETVHYFNAQGTEQGVARLPLNDYYYNIRRRMAISPQGEVFALMIRPTQFEVLHLNFYRHLEPLIPGAIAPAVRCQ